MGAGKRNPCLVRQGGSSGVPLEDDLLIIATANKFVCVCK